MRDALSGITTDVTNYAPASSRTLAETSRKTTAQEAERNRRLELERGFNWIEDRRARIYTMRQLAAEFLEAYGLRKPKSVTLAKYALGHLKRLLGRAMTVDISDRAVADYQTARLKEKAAPKSINAEVAFLLRLLGEQGAFIRAELGRNRSLRLAVARQVARAYTPAEKAALLAEAKKRRSPAIYPALVLALHAGLRDAEIRGLQWGRIDLRKAILTVGDAKSEAGQGRTIPLNADALAALVAHARWFLDRFGETRPEWYVFPFGKPQPTDPSALRLTSPAAGTTTAIPSSRTWRKPPT